MPAKQKKPEQAANLPELDYWIKNEANREWLKALLNDERWHAVCHYVLDKHRVTVPDIRTMPDTVIVRKAAVHTGAYEFVEEVRKLLNTATVKPHDLEPWGHINPITTP